MEQISGETVGEVKVVDMHELKAEMAREVEAFVALHVCYREWRLPDDLTRMVLLRVPANDLIRYKVVSKLWLSLISSPDFVSDQIHCANSDPSRNHLLLFHIDPLFMSSSFDLPRSTRSIMYFVAECMVVVGSVNGLICVVGKFGNHRIGNDDVWIMNLVTGHIMKLPIPAKPPRGVDTHAYCDREGSGCFTFWWDASTCEGDGEYKLAKVVPKKGFNLNTTIASLWVSGSPDTWSEIPVGFDGCIYHPSEFPSGCDVVVGDFAYWIVFYRSGRLGAPDVLEAPDNMSVLSLNLKTVSLSLYEVPFPLRNFKLCESIYGMLRNKSNYPLFAANWKGKFALVERLDYQQTNDVWSMDVAEGWSKKCSLHFSFSILKWIKNVRGKSVGMITVDPQGRPRKRGMPLHHDPQCGIALYDIETGEAEAIEDFTSGDVVDSAYDFVGSFASIKGFKPINKAVNDFRVIWPYPSVSGTNGK